MKFYKPLIVIFGFFQLLSVCNSEMIQQCPGVHCNRFCHKPEGECLQDSGRCLCKIGYTGPHPVYSKTYSGQIEADHCLNTCHPVLNGTACDDKCDARCFHPYGVCEPKSGKCLCWWGWTGPNAFYIKDGINANRVMADFCHEPCHYTPYYINEWCAQKDLAFHEFL